MIEKFEVRYLKGDMPGGLTIEATNLPEALRIFKEKMPGLQITSIWPYKLWKPLTNDLRSDLPAEDSAA